MSQGKPSRVHVIVGGFPPGSPAGHDMDYARLRLLELLQKNPPTIATVANDFADVAKWLAGSRLLVTYVAGPHPTDDQNEAILRWLEAGGRWLALHGTSGGKAVTVSEPRRGRKMVKGSHHATLGGFFLNHPPVRKFRVDIADRTHPIAAEMPTSFEVMDELYLIELQQPATSHILLTTGTRARSVATGLRLRLRPGHGLAARRKDSSTRVHPQRGQGGSRVYRAWALLFGNQQRATIRRYQCRCRGHDTEDVSRRLGDRTVRAIAAQRD